MLSRRELLLTPAALLAWGRLDAPLAAQGSRMSLCMHQNTSSRAAFRAALEGWARAGITQVELTTGPLDAFLKTESVATARRLLADLGLKPVSGACGVVGLVEPNPDRAAALDSFRQRCAQWAELGIPIIYVTTITSVKPTADDYKTAADRVREAGEIAQQHKLTLLFEFTRNSTFASTLPTMLSITRAAGLPNIGPLFDCYHFWSGYNKLEDLDLLRPGEIKHVHFQDVADMPRELLDMSTRVPPGDGVTPLVPILRKLAGIGYSGPLSIELLAPKYSGGDPFEVAREVRTKGEAVMRAAGVL